jgi:hypothetical protein
MFIDQKEFHYSRKFTSPPFPEIDGSDRSAEKEKNNTIDTVRNERLWLAGARTPLRWDVFLKYHSEKYRGRERGESGGEPIDTDPGGDPSVVCREEQISGGRTILYLPLNLMIFTHTYAKNASEETGRSSGIPRSCMGTRCF